MSEMTFGQIEGRIPFISRDTSVTGLCKGTRIPTLDGEFPVEFLEVGDHILTRTGSQILRRIAVRRVPMMQMIILRKGAFGPGCPSHDLHLPPDQVVRRSVLRSNFAHNAGHTYTTAAKLTDGRQIHPSKTSPGTLLFMLFFDADQVIYANGVEVTAHSAPKAARSMIVPS